MNQSFAVYPSNCAGAESKDAYAEAQFYQSDHSLWSAADPSAFHQYQQYADYGYDYSNYSELHEAQMNYAWTQQAQQNGWHDDAPQAGQRSAMGCCVNLDDFSDFSDSEEEAPAKQLVVAVNQPSLPKSMSSDSVRLDDAASTDAASTGDAASTTNASDSSDVESEVCPSPKANSRVYSLDALLLLRVAVGMCASPSAQWSTQPREGATTSSQSAEGDGSEWRREATAKQLTGASMKLVASANSWGARQIKIANSRCQLYQSDEEIVRGMKSILNKLTLEKFEPLYVKLINCGIRNDGHIKLLVHEIFEKACLQHHFVDMYADLCMRLEQWLGFAQTDTSSNEFRRILLNQCQESFEESTAPATELANDLGDEEQRLEAAARHKQRVLGNFRFIAALLSRGMLAPRVLLSVTQTLLKDPSAPDALESLAVFLTNVGPTFDDKEWPHYALLCSVFDQVDGLTKDKNVAPRLRFLLKDVLELRATNWADRKKATKKTEGPMKLKEVLHKTLVEEKAQVQPPRSLKTTKKGRDQNLKDLKAACASKPESLKTNQVVDKKHKSDGERKKSLVATAKAQYYGSATPPVNVTTSKSPPKEVQQPNAPFDLRTFRRQLNEVLKELGATRDTVSALHRLGGLQVPLKFQTNEFSNLLTRVAEERCGASRRVMFAFCASLAGKTFDRDMCANGIKSFFDDVYEDLHEEVPRLPDILKNEFVPTMRATIDADKLNKILPASLK